MGMELEEEVALEEQISEIECRIEHIGISLGFARHRKEQLEIKIRSLEGERSGLLGRVATLKRTVKHGNA